MKKTLLIISLIFLLSCGLMPQAYAADSLGELWNSRRSNVTGDEGYIHLDKKASFEGVASMRIYFKNSYKSNTYTKLESTQSIGFDTDKTYIFECYAKSTGGGKRMFGKLVWDWASLGNIEVTNTDWTYFSKIFKPDTTSNKFGIVFENQCDGWIDSLSIRVLDDDGNPTGLNLLENGGFEDCDMTAPADVADVETEGQDGAVVLSWKNPADKDLAAVNIYEFDEEAERLVASVTADGESSQVRIDGLENGKLYYYRLCARDEAWNESRGVEIYGAPTIDSYYTTPIVARAGTEIIDKLQAGNISFSTTVTNNSGGNDFTATLITAVYDGMRLSELKLSKAVIAEKDSAALETVITVPASYGNIRVESYLWSDTESMDSLHQSRVLTE